MHMSRLDCVQRFKESQLIIKLLVRRQGALELQVVNEDKKLITDESKISRESSPVPPPVPPRKLRQARGSADGHANPIPVKRQNGAVNSQCRANNPTSVDATNLNVTNNTNLLKEKSPASSKLNEVSNNFPLFIFLVIHLKNHITYNYTILLHNRNHQKPWLVST